MSTALPAPRLLVRTRTRCPYCEHVSPEDSKFCNECGAALHLLPCPHCGAVNDLTLTAECARCHGDLRLPEEPAAEAPPPTTAPVEAALITLAPVAPPPPPILPPAPARPPLLAVGIVLIGAAAFVGYYAYPPRAASGVSTAMSQAASAPAPQASSAPELIGPPAAGPDKSSAPAQVAADDAPALAAAPPAVSTAPGKTRPRPPRPPVARSADEPAAPSPGSRDPSPPPPRLGPCTEAVAALGLCSNNSPSEATPRRP